MKKKITFSIDNNIPMTGTLIAVDFVNRTATIEIDDPPDPEPLPLWGVKPDIEQDIRDKYYLAFDYPHSGDSFSIVTPAYPTRSEAITAWNRIATALNEIGEK